MVDKEQKKVTNASCHTNIYYNYIPVWRFFFIKKITISNGLLQSNHEDRPSKNLNKLHNIVHACNQT